MNFDIKKYKEAKQIQEKINSLECTENEQYNKEKRKIYSKYLDLESDLKRKKHTEENKKRKEHETKKENLKEQRAEADKKQKEFKRIISFMDILKKEKEFKKDDFCAYFYDYPKDENGEIKRVKKDNYFCFPKKEKIYLNSIGTLYEDKNLILKVYIGNNRKPKNKKSLFVLGKSVFYKNVFKSDIINIPNDYGINTLEENASIRKLIKDFPTEKEAKTYYENNKTKILKSFIEDHKKAVEELEKVRKKTISKDWQILYLEEKKENFKNNYSEYEENEDYKKLVAELKKLKGDF